MNVRSKIVDVILEFVDVIPIIVDVIPIIVDTIPYRFFFIVGCYSYYSGYHSENIVKTQSRTGCYSFILGSNSYFFRVFIPVLFQKSFFS